MTLAIGGSPASTNPSHGELWVNVCDYGAKADDGLTDNSAAIQSAIDYLISKLANSPHARGVVFFPSSPRAYAVTKTLWIDAPNIEIRGEGYGSVLSLLGGNRHNLLQFGIRRTEYGNVNGVRSPFQINSTNRPDLYRKLDSSVVTSPNVMWGIRTNNNSFVQFLANPMSSGRSSSAGTYYLDHWSETTKLTVEFCIEPPDGQTFPLFSPIMGMGVTPLEAAPFLFYSWQTTGAILVLFRTADIGGGINLPNRSFAFSVLGATTPYRIAVQFDLDNAICTAYVNGIQVAISSPANMSPTGQYPFTPNSGLRFQQNDYYPFMIGTDGAQGIVTGGNTGIDLRVYGFRTSSTLRYKNLGPGQPQTRVDNPSAPINDAYSYFTIDQYTIAFLQCLDNPATSGRVVTILNGNYATPGGISSGIFLHTTNQLGISGNAVRDIQLIAANGCGQTISLGIVLEMTIQNVKAISGFHAIGAFNLFATYNVYINDCWLDGFDSCYSGFSHLVVGSDIYCGQAGFATFREVGGSGNWKNILVAFASPNTETIFKFHSSGYGGNNSITNLVVDFEGTTLTLAGIYAEVCPVLPATSLLLKDIFLGSVGAQKPLVMLKDVAPISNNYRPAWISVENLQAFTASYLAAIDVDGPLWHGEVTGVGILGPLFNHRQKWGTTTHVVMREPRFTAPPRQYPWYSGAHILEVRSPVDWQFTEWRCAGSGTYGTSNPPKWVGLHAMKVTQNGVAGYLLNHGYITVTIN